MNLNANVLIYNDTHYYHNVRKVLYQRNSVFSSYKRFLWEANL